MRGFIILGFIASLGVNQAMASSSCADHYAGNTPPALLSPKLTAKARELCFQSFAVMHSGLTRTPLYSVEHLTASSVGEARHQTRVNDFHAEPQLPADERAELADYARSGFDRGHMSPSGDMPTPTSQEQSFTLANMIPQNPDNNRGLWAAIENSVRNLAVKDGEVWVVTGPIFEGGNIQFLKGRVAVPTKLFKAVYVPATGQTGVYLTPNGPGSNYQAISVAQLTTLTNIDPFPSVPLSAKQVSMALPAPQAPGTRHGANVPLNQDAILKNVASLHNLFNQ
jgi:endonuclease G